MAQLGVLEVKVQPDLTGFGSQVTSAMSSVGSAMGRLGATVARDLVGIGTSVGIAAAAATAGLATIGIRTAASLETAELQFTTLLGSATEAKQRVQELFQFARDTPFAAEEVLKASRTMQIFGGDALATRDNLMLVGDAAAGVGANFDEVAFWVSRSYALMQAGQPWGEAALRLQELGVLSGDARLQIEELAESGAASSEQWAVFTQDLERYSGSMEGLQNSFEGLQAQLSDIVSLGLAEVFRPAFESISDMMRAMRDASGGESFAAVMTGLGIVMSPLTSIIDRVTEAVERFGDMSGGQVLSGFERFGDIVNSVQANVRQFADSLGPLVPILGGIAAGFAATYASGIPLIGLLIPGFSGVTGALVGFLAVSEEARDSLANFGGVMLDAAQGGFAAMEGAIETVVDTLGTTFAGVLDALTPLLATLVDTLLPSLGNALGDILPPLGDIVVGVADLLGAGLEPLVPAIAAVVGALSGPLAATLQVVADGVALLADNAEIVVPALAGIAGAIAAVKIASFASELSLALAGFGALGGTLQAAQATIYGFATTVTQQMSGLSTGVGRSIGNIGLAFGGLSSIVGGLAIGAAVAGAVYLLTDSMQKQREEAEQAAEATRTYSQMIRDLGEEATAQTVFRDMAVESEELQLVLEAAGGSLADVGEGLRTTQGWYEALTPAMRAATDELAEQEGISTDAAWARINEAVRAADSTFNSAAAAAAGLTTEQEAGAASARDYSASIDLLKMEFDNLYGSQLNMEQQELRVAENFARLAEAAAVAGANLNMSTEAGRQNREVFASGVQGVWDFTSGMVAAGSSISEASAAGRGLRDQLVDQAVQFGLTEAQAEAYITELGLTPESIRSTAILADDQAKLDAQNYQNQLNTLDSTNPDSTVTADDNGSIYLLDLALNNASRDRTVNVRIQPSGYALLDAALAPLMAMQGRTVGEPMMGPTDDAAVMAMGVSPLAATTDTMTVTLRPRMYRPEVIDSVSANAQPVNPVIENRVYVGNQQITDIVRQEARIIERDRSMRYVTGIPSGVTL